MDKIIAHLGIKPYVDRFSQNFLLARLSVSYLLVCTWHTLLHYPHGANAGCDLAGVAHTLLHYPHGANAGCDLAGVAHTLLHYPHGANAGCDLAGVAPVVWLTSRRLRPTEIRGDNLSQTGFLGYNVYAKIEGKPWSIYTVYAIYYTFLFVIKWIYYRFQRVRVRMCSSGLLYRYWGNRCITSGQVN